MAGECSYDCDVIIAGGGLSGCLIALALAEKRPDLEIRLIESGARLGGNHIWSFFDSDVASKNRWLVDPLICHSWRGYDVIFPGHARTLDVIYNSIESERLDQVVRDKLPPGGVIQASVTNIESGHVGHYDVELDTGETLKARHAIDARGPGDFSTLQLGWQKFAGLSVEVPGGHGLVRPIVMDASVPQIDGYRFVYCLPFDAETIFIEDTYYSDTPDLDISLIRERIIDYARSKGWATNGGGREETGVLPVVTGGDFDAYWKSTGSDTAKAGLRSGMFHATTGYSLPDAVRFAASVPDLIDLDGVLFANAVRKLAKNHWRARGFYRLLDTMLFHAARPEQRYRVLERFYTLSPSLIARFYAGQSTLLDKLRILSGKPPVPIGGAMKAILGRRR